MLEKYESTADPESPLITLHGRPLNRPSPIYTEKDDIYIQTTPLRKTRKLGEDRFRFSPRSSPRRTPNSPRTSRLPVRSATTRLSVKPLRLPPDESIQSSGGGGGERVTPEKLMEELRERVKEERERGRGRGRGRLRGNEREKGRVKLGMTRKIDDEISLNVPFDEDELMTKDLMSFDGIIDSLSLSSILSDPNNTPRMSLRNRCPIIVDSPDLIYDDPLEIARKTLQNTRINSGYKHCKLIYTTEQRREIENEKEPAFSMKTGIERHFINFASDDESESSDAEGMNNNANYENKLVVKKLRFDRVLQLFEYEEEPNSTVIMEMGDSSNRESSKSCLKPPKSLELDLFLPRKPTQVVQIKRMFHEDDYDPAGNRKRTFNEKENNKNGGYEEGGRKRSRKLNGAKRLKKNG